MESAVAPPTPKAEPLFTLKLGDNGGQLAPTDYAVLTRWIQTEQANWSWLMQRKRGDHENALRECVDGLNHAANHASQAQQHLTSNPQHAEQQKEACKSRVEDVFLRRRLPHSSTPLAKRIETFRNEAGDLAASNFAAVLVSSQNGEPRFQPQELNAWRGLIEGLIERFNLHAAVAKGRKQAAEQSFEQLRTKAEQLVNEKTETYEALHRDYDALARTIRVAESDQSTKFNEAQISRHDEFDKLRGKHAEDMESLRKTFREEIALRAPAEYWEKKRVGHRNLAWVTGIASFAGIAIAAAVLGSQIHELLQGTAPNASPESWRIGILVIIAIFLVWGVRLFVRMFLSHLHLLTDSGERVVMVQTYLSLLEGDRLASKEDRQLILQALFRPASDGIVKDEGLPTSLAEALTRAPR